MASTGKVKRLKCVATSNSPPDLSVPVPKGQYPIVNSPDEPDTFFGLLTNKLP